MDAEPDRVRQAQRPADEGVVSHLRVRVQGQVVRDERQVVLEEAAQPGPLPLPDPARLRAPEEAVVHDQHLGALGRRPLEQFERRADPGRHPLHLRRADHLEADRQRVRVPAGVEVVIEEGDDLIPAGHWPTVPSIRVVLPPHPLAPPCPIRDPDAMAERVSLDDRLAGHVRPGRGRVRREAFERTGTDTLRARIQRRIDATVEIFETDRLLYDVEVEAMAAWIRRLVAFDAYCARRDSRLR